MNQARFAELGGVSKGSQLAYETGKTGPSADYLLRLQAHGVDSGYVLTGERSTARPQPGSIAEAVGPAIAEQAAASLRGILSVAPPLAVNDDADDTATVEEIDLAYGLGASFIDGPIRVRRHEISRTLLRSITATSPNDLTLARGVGDSMEPTISDGDIVLIDRSQQFQQDAIMALSVGELAMIKRVRRDGSKVQLLSDNQRIPPYDVNADEVNLVGRIVFVGRNM